MSTLATIQATDQITSSRTDINDNFTALNTDKIETSVLDTDTALAADSDAKIATQKAVKAYVDALGSLTLKTSGVSTGPTASGTQTVTHGLGRIPTVVRIYGIGGSNGLGSAGNSIGTYTSSGNRCLYIAASNTTRASTTSTTFSVRLSTNAAGSETTVATGVIQNVTTTSFDIVWTAAGDISANSFLWEAN
jgi:hypothetical protein